MSKETIEGMTTAVHNEWETEDFLMGQQRLSRLVQRLNLDPNLVEFLKHPKRSIGIVLPVRMDDGQVKTFWGYRVHHSLSRGPGAGGLRLHPQVNLGSVAAIAMLMTWKAALMDLPFGGAHGGIRVDPKTLSITENERLIRRYVTELSVFMGPDKDIIGPDLNTGERTMAWIMDTYSIGQGYTVPAVVTGKPKSLGGSVSLNEATGHGVALCTLQALKKIGIKESSPKVIIQGFGHVGSVAAKILHEHGCKIIGISDSSGAIYSDKGINLETLIDGDHKSKPLINYAQAEHLSNQELFEQNCDVLIPCATPNQLTKNNAAQVNCKLIVEGASAPITLEADDILSEKGVLIVPDILANAAGLSVSYYEWVQGIIRLLWSEEETLNRLKQLMTTTCDQVFSLADAQKLSWREAAMQIAVTRIIETRRLRGLYP